MSKHVIIFLADGFEEIEALTPVDVLRRAGIQVSTVSIQETRNVTGAHQIVVKADALFTETDFDKANMVVLPGGMPGAKNLNEHEGVKNILLRFAKENKLIGAICAAPMVPGQLGLLKNKKATCYPGFESHLKDAEVTGQPVEVADNMVTGKGVGAALKFSLELVALLTDRNTANELAEKMGVENC
ncbi:DJ-1/PfpI family protein [Marinilabiliaceae bacterium JC017]|nr:DJ-1/PfpI family protein [Marinilabiliaceae bacterium JC017]